MIRATKVLQQAAKTVEVAFLPEIMKLGLKAQVGVSQTTQLDKLKTDILNVFWQRFPGMYEGSLGKKMNIGKHGTAKNVIVEDLNFQTIKTTEQLQQHIDSVGKVYARFTKKPTE